MKNIKQTITSTKNFVKRNECRILVIALASTSAIVAIQHSGIKSLNEFLEDNGLTESYYHFNEDETV